MINSAKADNRLRKDFYKNMCRLQFYKYIVHNQNIPQTIRVFYKGAMRNLSPLVRIRNRCILTGRGRGVYKFCKLSRGLLQEKGLAGDLMGISKSSW